ncbi:FKBP-type peptidyl-prolyl cis-trans isomerase [Candidatus Methanoperedens nitroreducens]|uniref:Peptidyl-prolyl cis-trans isomerase n=1 Tax=Candidatus Methanoperedens nitratireducens TaxID=1392998 RepID=A0A062VCP3_9EURY|nr:peptidylprolyl isomerase [Candidatus Methanoperedens nitroreducens]KCZ73020.1 FKBP-type peptidyl-prolyl cis-trans isomerase [Candidatus Methanoperedens nitroreducens]MDJ1423036.1 peptidylprolyl isomerase [Candidatus Methanoperedens sp.]
MSIQKGDFIKVSYTGRNDDRVFDTTDEEVAKANDIFNEKGKYGGDVIIVGSGHVVEGLDEDFIDKEVGYRGSITIPPEKAFGQRNPELIETIPITKFDQRPQVGMYVQIDGRTGMVTRVIGRMAQVDFNRFLAGQTVTYEYEIKEKIEDTEGKVHGLLGLYIGKDFTIQIDGETLTVEIEPELTFNQRWLMSKRLIANEIINNTDIKEVLYVEKYNSEVLAPKTSE